MSIASVDQVRTWMGSDMPSEVADAQLQAWIDALEHEIRTVVKDFASRAADPDYVLTVRNIEIAAVERKLRNLQGYASESVDNVALSYRSGAASGVLQLTADEWSRLGVASEIGSANITPGAPNVADIPWFRDDPGWGPWVC